MSTPCSGMLGYAIAMRVANSIMSGCIAGSRRSSSADFEAGGLGRGDARGAEARELFELGNGAGVFHGAACRHEAAESRADADGERWELAPCRRDHVIGIERRHDAHRDA